MGHRRMIKVLVDGIAYGTQKAGGISRCFTETVSRLCAKSDDFQVIVHLPRFSSGLEPRGPSITHIRDVNLHASRLQRVASALSKLQLKMSAPQIFHSTYYSLPYWPGLRSVVTVHDFIHEEYPTLLGDAPEISVMKRDAIESADVIIAVSNHTKEGVIKHTNVDKSRITVIYHGVADTFLAPAPEVTTCQRVLEKYGIGVPYWLFVGTRWSYKNFGTLLRAFTRISDQTGGSLVTVGGEASLERWQFDWVIKYGIEKRLRVLRGIDDEELRLLYSAASGFVFPSLAEGFGIPLLEAMACGVPVIASDIPVFHEVAADAAVYVDPHNEEALADAMLQVLRDDVREPLIGLGRKCVQRFSWDTAAEQLGEVYRSLV